MSKKLQLSIPKPCHENWDAMTPVEKGRFCGSCQKQVVDFSTMSDRQVAEFFKKPSTGSVCGRFMTDQLERDIEIPKKRIPWLKYFFQFTIPAFLLSLKASSQATKGKIKVTAVAKDSTAPVCRPLMGAIARPVEHFDEKGMKGMIIDAVSGLPLTAASIVMHSTIGKETIKIKYDGSFILNNIRKITISHIEISMPGYEEKSISWNEFLNMGDGNRIIKLHREMMLKGEIAVNTCRMPVVGDTTASYLWGDVEQAPVQKHIINKGGIKGRVIDEKGSPVPFASILSGNPLSFIIVDEKGEFTLPHKNIPQDRLLNVSSVGFQNISAQISSQNEAGETMLIIMKSKILDEVVVTALSGPVMGMITTGTVVRIASDPLVTEKASFAIDNAKHAVNGEQGIRIYPNPLPSGENLSIEWKGKEEGYYSFELLNQSGQTVHQQQLWIDAEARLLTIDLPWLAAGNYFVVMTNKKSGKKYSEKLIIQ